MVAQRPSAAFDPIPPDLDLASLVEETPNFEYVTRISCDMIETQGLEAFDKLVLLHVILGGKPLVVEGFQHRLDEWTFTTQWLQDNYGKKFEQARNLSKQQNMTLSIGHYLNNMSKLTDQWNRQNYKERDRQRIYLKDLDCPQIWHDKLQEQIPPSVFYLNESIGDFGGPGSIEEHSSGNMKGLGVARAGDLMSCLPPSMRADNMMCYIGHEGTYTPAHREMCASLGQNLMVETSGLKDRYGKHTKPGSSIWFMTETNDRHTVSEYWLATLGHDIEVESHFAQINAWKAAPFKTYIVDQRVGDFILIPPLAPHQVWNRGTVTMKVAWNRTTVETLEMALHEALPRARIVCRDEQYKNKSIVYFALMKYSDLLKQANTQRQSAPNHHARMEIDYSPKIRQLQKDFKRLFALYTEILLSEMLAPVSASAKHGQYLPYESFVTCSYCRCNIFNRFLTCTTCIVTFENGDEDTYDICMECFAMGRSCSCLSKYKWVEQFPWQELEQKHDRWRHQIINFENGLSDKSPQPFDVERRNLGKKTLAQVCQEQLKIRPWSDPENPLPPLTSFEKRHLQEVGGAKKVDDDIEVDDEGNIKKPRKRNFDKLSKEYARDHVSQHPEYRWKLAPCTKCDRHYGYGSLFRGFDLMPLTVMENPNWECPHCLKICSAAKCGTVAGFEPYEPSGTMLGHDTRKVADPRSVESLVDFSVSNGKWIKKTGDDHPQDNRRLSRRKDEAEQTRARDPALNENYVDEEEHTPVNGQSQYFDSGIKPAESGIPIDPMLSMHQPIVHTNGNSMKTGMDRNRVQSSNRAQIRGRDRSSSVSSSDDEMDWERNQRDMTSETRRPYHMAPMANMINQNFQGQGFTSNGIAYEYPDPTMSQPSPSKQPSNYLQQEIPKQTVGKIVESDAVLPPQHNGPDPPHLTQLERMLEDAKLGNRYICTEASITGKSLRVKLLIPQTKLAALRVTHSQPIATNGIQAIRKEAPILLQSDLPSVTHTEVFAAPPKKRKTREELDEEFSTRKRKAPKSSIAPASAKDSRKTSVNYTESSSDSETAQEETISFVPVNKSQGPRPLPKYLAQRSEGHQSLTPDEVPNRRKPSPPREQPTPLPSAPELQLNNDLESSLPPTQSAATAPRPPKPSKVTFADETLLGTQAAVEVPEMHIVPVDFTQKLAEENRKAKLKALQWANDDEKEAESSGSDSSSTSSDEDSQRKPNGKLLTAPKSIFSTGKKIKIVAAAKSASTIAESSLKIKGGRPRKSMPAAFESAAISKAPAARGRGRPRKSVP
ncbi:MAG: hypothetical protein ASARMPREDX12_003947 [Alectoria sarmentosa]|nr:MAG: hypothetical protein ASARMPREDX12_003947 [Alectoria sarmentosa]CAD6588922.1 MAG: hypothetical protein ASARMPRED_003832 [Alectoria sarmentosa]